MATSGAIRAGRAFVEIFAEDNKLIRGLRKAESSIRDFGKKISGLGAKAWGGALPGPIQQVFDMIASPAGLLAGFTAATKTFATLEGGIAAAAKRSGTMVEAMSVLDYAATQTDTSLEAVEAGLRGMTKMLAAAAEGGSEAQDTLLQLNLTFDQIRTKQPHKAFQMIAERLSKIANPTQRAALAMKVFGKSGTQLMALVEDGADGLRRFGDEASRLGIVLDKDLAEVADRLDDRFSLLGLMTKKLAAAIGGALAGDALKLTERMIDAIAGAIRWIKANRELVITVAKVTAGIVAGGIALAAFGFVISKIAVVLGIATSVMVTLASAATLLLNPISLVAILVVTLADGFVGLGNIARGTFGAIRNGVRMLWRDLQVAGGAVMDALSGGDLAAAWKVITTLIKLEWANLTGYLRGKWAEFKAWFQKAMVDIWVAIQNAPNNIWSGLKMGFEYFITYVNQKLNDLVTTFTNAMDNAITSIAMAIVKLMPAWAGGGVGTAADMAKDMRKRREDRNKENATANTDLTNRRDAKVAEMNKARKEANLPAEQAGQWKKIQIAAQAMMDAVNTSGDVAKAQADFDEAVAAAKAAGKKNQIGPRRFNPGGAEDWANTETMKGLSTAGTFNPLAAFGMGGPGKDLSDINSNTKKTELRMQRLDAHLAAIRKKKAPAWS